MNLSSLFRYRISARGWGLLGGVAASLLMWVLIWNYIAVPVWNWLFT